MIETASGEDEGEGGALVTATAPSIKASRASELGADGDEGFVEELLLLEIANQCGDGGVQLLNEEVLIGVAFVVDVPTGAVHEVEVVGDLDEAHACLNEAPGKKASLAEFVAIFIAQAVGLFLEVEVTHEAGSSQTEGFLLGLLVVGDEGIIGGPVHQRHEQLTAALGPGFIDV